MDLQDVVIIGAGAFAREVLDVFEAVNRQSLTFNVLGFIVDSQYGSCGTIINDKPILGDFSWFTPDHRHVAAICAISAPDVRFRLVQQLELMGIQFCTLIHPTAIISRWATVGSGSYVGMYVIVDVQVTIGRHCQFLGGTVIGHDSIIEDFVGAAPGVHISGNDLIKQGTAIGVGANIIEKKTVGEWSVIGAGSTVIHDIPDNTTAVGTPARVIKTRPHGWHLAS